MFGASYSVHMSIFITIGQCEHAVTFKKKLQVGGRKKSAILHPINLHVNEEMKNFKNPMEERKISNIDYKWTIEF